jgi:hypothetical protein
MEGQPLILDYFFILNDKTKVVGNDLSNLPSSYKDCQEVMKIANGSFYKCKWLIMSEIKMV